MKAFVTGGLGQAGSHVVEVLLARGGEASKKFCDSNQSTPISARTAYRVINLPMSADLSSKDQSRIVNNLAVI